jgi:hypothetical protein
MRSGSSSLQVLVIDQGGKFFGALRDVLPYGDTPINLQHELDEFSGLARAARQLPDIVLVARDLWEQTAEDWTAVFHKLFPGARTKVFFLSGSDDVTELLLPETLRPVHVGKGQAGVLGALEWAADHVELMGCTNLLSAHQIWRFRDYQTPRDERQTILNLCKLAALRDRPSANHIQRIAAYSQCIARHLGMPTSATEALSLASMLHDIGHVNVPEAVLFQAQSLNPDELEMMKAHPRAGHHILSAHEGLTFALAAELTLAHHERWDGSGYPSGLAGEDIPFSARIVAVADAFDLITGSRHDRAHATERAIRHLQRQAGTAFDAFLVAEFEKVVPELQAVMERFPFESDLGHTPNANSMPSPVAHSRRGLAALLDEFEDCQALLVVEKHTSFLAIEAENQHQQFIEFKAG